jgi:hypothetical protein
LAVAVEAMTVDKMLKDQDALDGKEVTVTGVVSDYRQRESRAGNPYVNFKLKGENKVANVYLRGSLEGDKAPKNGDTVEVMGIYRKEKKVNDSFTVKDEVDASPVEKKKFGVKITKRGE